MCPAAIVIVIEPPRGTVGKNYPGQQANARSILSKGGIVEGCLNIVGGIAEFDCSHSSIDICGTWDSKER